MAQRSIEILIGRLMTDEAFRFAFRRDAMTTLAGFTEFGYELTPVEIAALCATPSGVWEQVATNIDPHAVTKGRKAVNFSEWAAYSPEQQRMLLAASCEDTMSGRMPGPYALLHPVTRLSAHDVETICAAAAR